ncbi:polyketide synthase, partial [Streptomyces sp. 2MCAF27]
VDWKAWFAPDPDGPLPSVIDLPTYAFQHQHYWPTLGRLQGDVSTAGMRPVEHGLLSAAIGTADGRLILTGRLPAGNRAGWLRDHEVAGTILLPASMVMEWALRAADEVGCPTIEELVLQAPVLLDETDPRRIQVTVAAPAPDGRRELLVHSCSEDDAADTDDTWVCHAAGTVSTQAASPAGLAGQWPPPGAEPLDVSGCYERAAAAGLRYGPVFQ